MLYSDESTFQLVSGKNGFRVLSPKDQRDHPDFHQRQKQKQTSVMVWGLDQDQCQFSVCMCYNSVVSRHVDVTDWPADLSPIENVWPIMKRRIRQ